MDYNKDLTMESDFIGMFNPVRGLRKNNNGGSGSSSVDPEQLQGIIQNTVREMISPESSDNSFFFQAVSSAMSESNSALSPLFMSDCDLLTYKPDMDELHSFAVKTGNDYFQKRVNLLDVKYTNLGYSRSIYINVKAFSEKNVNIHFHSKNAKYSKIQASALNPVSLYMAAKYDLNTTNASALYKYLITNDSFIGLLNTSKCYVDINTSNPDNPTLVEGDVSFDKSVIVRGDNVLTGSFNKATNEFTILINGNQFAKLQNVNKWGYRIRLSGFDKIKYITYDGFDITSSNNSYPAIPLNLRGFNNYYFADAQDDPVPDGLLEVFFNHEPISVGLEWFTTYVLDDYTPFLLDYGELSSSNVVYFCEDSNIKYGLCNGILVGTKKRSDDYFNNFNNYIRSYVENCLGVTLTLPE